MKRNEICFIKLCSKCIESFVKPYLCFFFSFLPVSSSTMLNRLRNVCLPSIEVFSLKVKCKASFAKHKPKYNHWGLNFLKFNFKISFYLFVFELVIYIS